MIDEFFMGMLLGALGAYIVIDKIDAKKKADALKASQPK